MNSEKLLTAITGIDSKYIQEAQARLGYCTENKKRGGHKKLWRTLLIAAAISALFTAAAAAAGWFGLSGLKIGTNSETGRSVISLQGVAGSPEARAVAELTEYCDAHPRSYKTNDLTEEESLKLLEEYGGYAVYNREGYQKVDELCKKYGLRKLGRLEYPEGERAFCEAAGIGRLTREHGGWQSRYLSGYIYEEGTFDMQGVVDTAELPYSIMYDFRRASKGTLGYVVGQIEDVNMFTEWDYTSSDGVKLHLANAVGSTRSERASFILLDSSTAFYVMSFSHSGYADYLGDGIIDGIGDASVEFDISNEELEKLADSFDWAALTDPERGMDSDFENIDGGNDGAASPADMITLDSEPDFGAVTDEDMYFIKIAYKESIEPYISGFELIDYSLIRNSYSTEGWVQFSGTPKERLDWDCTAAGGKIIYCRSLNMLSDDEGGWSMDEAYDALPYKPLSDYENAGTQEEPDYVYAGRDLSGITSAQLYVRQLGRSYELPAEKLHTLELMLRDDGTGGTFSACKSMNPLWLTMAGGRRTVIYTAGDGSNAYTDADGGWRSYSLGVSIFDLFGVPLEAAGYSEANGVVTAHNDGLRDGSWTEYDFAPGGFVTERRVCEGGGFEPRRVRYELDAEGRLLKALCCEPDGSLSYTAEYKYNEDGKILEEYMVNDRFWTRKEYVYDDQGRLTLEKAFSDDHPDGNERAYKYYDYDSEGRCRVSFGFQRDQS